MVEAAPVQERPIWACLKCTTKNNISRKQCRRCGSKR